MSSFESRLFLARRLAGVPGYQYDVDISKEFIIRQIFTVDEAEKINESFQNVIGHEYRKHMLFDVNFYLLDINRIDKLKIDEDGFGIYKDANNNAETEWSKDVQEKLDFLGLQHPSEILITKIDDDEMKLYQNDKKFKNLSKKDQNLVKFNIRHMRNIEGKLTKPLCEAGLSFILYVMKRNYGH